MIRYSSSLTIERPPEEVFAALVDIERYPLWTPMVDSKWLTPGEPRLGTRGEFRLSEGPITGILSTEIVELVPNRKVVFAVEHPALRWRSASSVEPVGTGTRLTYAGELGMLGWRRLLEPLMAREVRTGEQKEAERLKELLEAGAAATQRAAATA